MTFIKHYADNEECRTAAGNYQWLSRLNVPRLPHLLSVMPRSLTFEFVAGRHARIDDLEMLGGYLGRMHAEAFRSDLHLAKLDEPHGAIPSFVSPRKAVIEYRLHSGQVPGPLLTQDDVTGLLLAGGPAAFYKDTNPRNILITHDGPCIVDFDDLTLAPFGYDLAKLVVATAMTYGAIPAAAIEAVRRAYNNATAGIANVTTEQFMGWAEIHHILTSRYLGRGGYRYSWHLVRPLTQP